MYIVVPITGISRSLRLMPARLPGTALALDTALGLTRIILFYKSFLIYTELMTIGAESPVAIISVFLPITFVIKSFKSCVYI